jgi:hypothetical protein
MQIDCSFLMAEKTYEHGDSGRECNLRAIDFQAATKVERNSRLDIRLAKGGGWVGDSQSSDEPRQVLGPLE